MSIRIHILPGKHDLLALAARDPKRYPVLLQSVAVGPKLARFDVLAAFPMERVGFRNDADFAAAFDAQWQAAREENANLRSKRDDAASLDATADAMEGLPFRGGWLMFLSYELARSFEPRLRLPTPHLITPTAVALRCPAAILVDHENARTIVIAESGHEARIAEMMADLQATIEQTTDAQAVGAVPTLPSFTLREDDPTRFIQGVQRIQQYLIEGDVFQVNLSRAWRGEFSERVKPDQVFQCLRQANPSPFAALWQDGDFAVISSSPERLVESDGARVQTRPIAGTRPRDARADPQADAARVKELLGSLKERAEHVMLIDLERNDLGRICAPGSVIVDELMSVESYTHVHHIVSNVSGQLREGITPGQILRALFPGGTITGCPKVRCMEIISELEGEGRGAYTGSVGYVNHDGSMDFNILIRSIAMRGTAFEFRAGAGIVMDSIAEKELDETRAKARGMLRAFGVKD